MSRAVLFDTSAVMALLDARDPNHAAAVAIGERMVVERRPSFVTNYIQAEAHALIGRRLGRFVSREWLLRGGMTVLRVTAEEEARAMEIIDVHEDKEWSLCDAISFALMHTRSPHAAFSFDHHFRQYGRFRVLGLDP